MFVFRFLIYDLNAEQCIQIVLVTELWNLFSNMHFLNYEMGVRKEITYKSKSKFILILNIIPYIRTIVIILESNFRE